MKRNQDFTSTKNEASAPSGEGRHERAVTENDGTVQPRAQRQPEVADAPSTGSQLDHHDTSPTGGSDLPDAAAAPPDGGQVYTMDTLPQGRAGIFRVLVDGKVVEVAVDIHGENSPVGNEDFGHAK